MAKAPFKAGYVGGRKRPYITLEAAVDGVRRLWVDGSPASVLRLARGGAYEVVEVFHTRPTAPADWAGKSNVDLVTEIRRMARLGCTDRWDHRLARAELDRRADNGTLPGPLVVAAAAPRRAAAHPGTVA